MKLSEHFTIKEIFWNPQDGWTWSGDERLRMVQIELAKMIVQKLEMIRARVGLPILITSGCRNIDTMARARRDRWVPQPSYHSDHFYMGKFWPLGSGAVDFVPLKVSGKDLDRVLEDIFIFVRNTIPREEVGQCIIYRKERFIHISNGYEQVFGQDIAKWMRKQKVQFLEYVQGKYRPV